MTANHLKSAKLPYWCLYLPGLLALGLGAYFAVGSSEFCLDDAWIHLSYAKSLRLGEGFSYNPGDWETGDSAPLWALLLALLPPNDDIVLTTKIFGISFHVLCAVLTSWYVGRLLTLSQESQQSRSIGLIAMWAGISCAALPPLLQGATSGMEVSIATAFVLAGLCADLKQSWRLACLISFLAVFARVETFVIFCSYGGILALIESLSTKRPPYQPLSLIAGILTSRHLWLAWGSGFAFAIWTIYNLLLTGYPFPNTYYIKGVKAGFEGLAYIHAQLLPSQPWWSAVTGVLLISIGAYFAIKKRNWPIIALFLASVVTLIVISITIWVKPGVLFFHLRYYLPVMTLPLIVVAYGLAQLQWWQGVLAIIPIVVLNIVQIPETRQIQREQERGIDILHTRPAKLIAQNFAADSRIMVEGAGAVRFFTPRTMHIIDVVGLNDAKIAHAASYSDYTCEMIRQNPNLGLLPTDFRKAFERNFEFQLMHVFDDMNNMQGVEPTWARVELLQVKPLKCD